MYLCSACKHSYIQVNREITYITEGNVSSRLARQEFDTAEAKVVNGMYM